MAEIYNFEQYRQKANKPAPTEDESAHKEVQKLPDHAMEMTSTAEDISLLASTIGGDPERYGILLRLSEIIPDVSASKYELMVRSYSAEELVGYYKKEISWLQGKPAFLKALLDEIKRRVEIMKNNLR